MDQSYAADVCMEPMFWFVDNFTYAIGPVSSFTIKLFMYLFSVTTVELFNFHNKIQSFSGL